MRRLPFKTPVRVVQMTGGMPEPFLAGDDDEVVDLDDAARAINAYAETPTLAEIKAFVNKHFGFTGYHTTDECLDKCFAAARKRARRKP